MTAVVEQVVDVTNFIAESKASKEALKSANILKSININAVIEGESGNGKLTLAKLILPNSIVIEAHKMSDFENLEPNSSVIIKDFNKVTNLYKFKELVQEKSIRIIATSNETLRDEIADRFFGIRIYIPKLKDRAEDIKFLAEKFLNEAKDIFGEPNKEIDLDSIDFDLSKNSYSLKRSIFLAFLFDTIKDNEIIKIIEHYLQDRVGNGDDYREFLYLYEIPLIKVSLDKFKSQLKVSEKLGINRNTLRKKITSYKENL
jgi:DNA-binding NtrC family response regulator